LRRSHLIPPRNSAEARRICWLNATLSNWSARSRRIFRWLFWVKQHVTCKSRLCVHRFDRNNFWKDEALLIGFRWK
jgi:hypothetical protein